MGLRDTPVPGQSRHWCRGGPQHPCGSSPRRGAAPHRDSCASTWRAPGKREPGVRQGPQGTPPTTLGQGSCSHGLAVLQHLTPTQPPPTLCLLQTIVLHLHKLSPRAPETTVSRRGVAVRAQGGEGQRGRGRQPRLCWRWGQERPARGARRGPLSSPSAPREARRRRRAQGTGASSRVCAGVAARWGQGPSRHSRPPARPGAAAAVLGLAAGPALPGQAVAAAPSSGAQSAVHCIYLYINKDSSAVVLQ